MIGDRNFIRAFGSLDRVLYVQSIPCVVHRCLNRNIENAHVAGGGVGIKGPPEMIVPLCHDHHHELHQHGRKSFELKYRVNLLDFAARIERLWQEYLAAGLPSF